MTTVENTSPIGIFDSGVGGLSVLREITPALPSENVLYLADQAHVPYGRRSKSEILDFSKELVRYLMGEGAKLIVVACNTASAAALVALREEYPGYPFVGIEPAVKPAARRSQTNIVGVLATPSTFKGEPYASLVERFAQDTQLLTDTCPGLVQEIEAGGAKGSEARRILRDALEPMLAQGIDSLVLGCTHYPFAIETIREIVGAEIEVLDPAPAIARHVQALLQEQGLLNPGPGPGWVRYSTTGDAARLREQIYELIGEDAETAALQWQGGSLGGLGT